MIIQSDTTSDWIEVCLRWHQATIANKFIVWRALMHWMAAESMIHDVDGMHDVASDYAALSDLARQHMLDLQPARIEEQAA